MINLNNTARVSILGYCRSKVVLLCQLNEQCGTRVSMPTCSSGHVAMGYFCSYINFTPMLG